MCIRDRYVIFGNLAKAALTGHSVQLFSQVPPEHSADAVATVADCEGHLSHCFSASCALTEPTKSVATASRENVKTFFMWVSKNMGESNRFGFLIAVNKVPGLSY